VVKYLTDKGIAVERLEAKGFGPDRPVATNDSDAGRAQNRRVEFKVISTGEP
jgi:outer membrane protein OmpA-like peptidoglycan-associated protein